MPYADPEKQRAYKAKWARKRRQGSTGTPGVPCPTTPLRLGSTQDVLDMVSATVGQVQNDHQAGTLEKARVIGTLGGVALKALEAGEPKSSDAHCCQQISTEQTEPPGWSKEEFKKKLKSLSMAECKVLHGILVKFRAMDRADTVHKTSV